MSTGPRLLRPLYAWTAARQVRTFMRGRPAPAAVAHFLQHFRPPGDNAVTLIQKDSEIEALLDLLSESRPRRVLEIGTAGGGSLALFSAAAADDAVLVSVDIPGGYRRPRALIYRQLRGPKQVVKLIHGDSHETATRDAVVQTLAGQQLDFLFIDGDHRREGVTADYRLYAPLVREGGLVAFHDIVPGAEENVGSVPAFWQELKSSPPGKVREIVEDWGQGGCGIGVVELASAIESGPSERMSTHRGLPFG